MFGLLAPAGTPAAVLVRLNAEVNQALQSPALRGPLLAADNLPTGGSAADFVRPLGAEHAAHRAAATPASSHGTFSAHRKSFISNTFRVKYRIRLPL